MESEWHHTVKGDVYRWLDFCSFVGVKPLFIELNNWSRQLMCASPRDLTQAIRINCDFELLRTKHEVYPPSKPDGVIVKYYESHVKLNGPFLPITGASSRDLLREHRWYVTRRQSKSFDAAVFADRVFSWLQVNHNESAIAEIEYEACILDTNPDLDKGWL